MLWALKASLNMEDPFEACIWAMASCAYWGMMRFAEVSVHSRVSFVGTRHLKCVDVLFDKDQNGRCYVQLNLPAAKTAVAGEKQSVFLVEQQGLCLLEALENLARVVPAGPNDPLFSWMDRRGNIHPMVKEAALEKINAIIMSHGWGTMFGHSFRIGGASFYLAHGVSLLSDGWASVVFSPRVFSLAYG